jgi:thiosulfate reductase cytochrome b subunit
MADSAWVPGLAAGAPTVTTAPRHSAVVRITHWLTALCFLALLVSGIEVLILHPRFYWGETGNVNTPPLFQLPIPASRSIVPTGYGYVLPDQNGWSRSLHFQAAWAAVFTGLLYLLYGFFSGHFRRDLLPAGASAGSVPKPDDRVDAQLRPWKAVPHLHSGSPEEVC